MTPVPVPVVTGQTGANILDQNITGRRCSYFSANGAKHVKTEKGRWRQITSNMVVLFSKTKQKTNTCSDRREREQLVTSSLHRENKGDHVKCGLNFEKRHH